MNAHRMWMLLETVHAVVYFAPEVRAALSEAGLRGFWMGYFGGRAAPLGPVGPEMVTALFYNFAPPMVRRSIPDAWTFATPERILEARLDATGVVLERLVGDGRRVADAADLVRRAAEAGDLAGRPLYAAHAALPWPTDPVPALWHGATLLREHRGDGHVAALLTAGVDGCEAHVLRVAAGSVDRPVLQDNRGWSDEEWTGAEGRLRGRGVIGPSGRLTAEGGGLLLQIERATDDAASRPWSALSADELGQLEELLLPMARLIASGGLIPYPNPMGLPPVA